MSRLKFATEHVIWIEEQWDHIPFSDESKFNLFGCHGRSLVRHSPKERYSPQCTKNSVKFGWSLIWFLMPVQDLLSGYTVKLTQQNTKRYWRNMLYLICELQLINPLYLYKITICHTEKSLKTFLSEEDVTVMEWPTQSPDMNLLRMFGSY